MSIVIDTLSPSQILLCESHRFAVFNSFMKTKFANPKKPHTHTHTTTEKRYMRVLDLPGQPKKINLRTAAWHHQYSAKAQ